LGNTEKEETYRDADEIKTFRNEALVPIGRLKDSLNCIDITTLPEFRIKRIQCPGQEEYKTIVEILSGPNVLSHHKGPTFRATYQDAVADAAWQAITGYNHKYHDELRNTVYHLLPQRNKNKFKTSGVKDDVPRTYGASPGCVYGDEHPSAGCSVGDPVTHNQHHRLSSATSLVNSSRPSL
jgi:hypothetical protein